MTSRAPSPPPRQGLDDNACMVRVGMCANCGGDILVALDVAETIPAAPSSCGEACQNALVSDMRYRL